MEVDSEQKKTVGRRERREGREGEGGEGREGKNKRGESLMIC